MSSTVVVTTGDALTARQVYAIWKIRDAVFAFEQHVDDVEPDDLDLLAGTTHLWSEVDGVATSYLRVLEGDGYLKVGRVCTLREHRNRGLSGALMDVVIERWGHGELRLNAQAYLEQWYGRWGFERTGPNFDEAGIDHVPMTRAAGA